MSSEILTGNVLCKKIDFADSSNMFFERFCVELMNMLFVIFNKIILFQLDRQEILRMLIFM